MIASESLNPAHVFLRLLPNLARLHSRFSLPLVMLLAFLQRTPVLRVLVGGGAELASLSPGHVLRSGLALASVLGAVDTLAGATTFVCTPAGNPEGTFDVTVGTPVSVSFTVTDAPTPVKSFKIQGTFPPGLSIAGLSAGVVNNANPVISGTPTTAGTYTVQAKAYDKIGGTGKTDNVWYDIIFIVANGAVTPPSITTQPASATVTEGGSASFSVTAAGSDPLSYQWRFNGSNIGGATSATYSLSNAQSANAGNYSVVVTNSAGSVTSNNASLTVNAAATAPNITTQPAALSVTAGDTASFSVTASGTAPLSYQWRFNGSNISGATSSTYSLSNAQSANAGNYSVVVTNSAGSVTSSNAALTVNAAATAPSITTQPAALSVTAGDTASFSVTASGTAPLSYQWRFNGSNISGATSSTYSLSNAQSANAGNYSVVVTNSAGSVTSSNAALTVNPANTAGKPSFTTQPLSSKVAVGQMLSLVASAASPNPATPVTYQWLKNGSPIQGATGAILNLTSISSGDAGSYSVRATNASGSTFSAVAAITVTESIGNPLTNMSILTTSIGGDPFTMGFVVSGTTAQTVIIRASGPSIASVTAGTMADPMLTVFDNSQARVADNDNWDASLASVFTRTGAFPFLPGSKDAALVITLPPGPYTVQVRAADGSTGKALAEVFLVQIPSTEDDD